ncbi:glycoside hydrolase/phage tail family protein [Nitratireductor sp. GZWM139]|uniref:baseplate multidomain protein megatron n=1 Tax=Nitratireductor sp. GZWM139 TaxID=2950541 RepID=UPI0024BDD748|nr:glycoside hydrolase/phage tail family protein [Nitratireductor sp. GZWM139]MDJ1463397.1 glycoside hydrolase/phage tail family protein [Nitratireductor sp. GZWM139]
MATIFLGVVGASIGGTFGVIGGLVGQAVGALAGSFADRAIVSALTPPVKREGPRLTSTDIQTATEGSDIDRVYGRARVTGEVFWATRFEEVSRTERSGGKGMKPKVEVTTYHYYANFAVGLCEGPIAGIGRIWADGKEIDQTEIEFRVHKGTETQAVDPLIEAKEGSGNAPAYRGLAYLVFERLHLESYGNRLPQIAVEVFRPTGALEQMVPGVAVIGANEMGFETEEVRVIDFFAGGIALNRHTRVDASDWLASMNRLQDLAPNVRQVLLVLPWFGDDLRCGSCSCRPKVDSQDKATNVVWSVAGLFRSFADLISLAQGIPAYGGSPSDQAVVTAIRDLNARGISVTVVPFLMMDVAEGNALADPYSDHASSSGQPAYPWRGRITCSPAPGFAGSPDKTAGAAGQVSAFVGSASASDFSSSGEAVEYSGPEEWSYRRFILHYAKLAAIAGGVESFLIGTEMRGLTQVRSSAGAYPFVNALRSIAAEVRSLLGGSVKIGYAADWSEYHSHRLADGTGDVWFNLDPLWSDANIDFIGIDNYLPIADWRDGTGHLDYSPNGPTTIYDRTYLASNVEGGEYYDWFYASDPDRRAQTRTPITDGAHGKPWVFRQKDIRAWWANAHVNRPGGSESGAPTGWVPEAKPIRFTELGCPAVDKGANQPNVFVDPKSSESFYPHFSSRARDDAMQRAFLETVISYWSENNQISSVYAGPMIETERTCIWAWDARPHPSFPQDLRWGDAANWELGHWISGRLGTAPGTETVRTVLEDAGFTYHEVAPLPTVVEGITTGRVLSARAMLEALQTVYQFEAVETGGRLKVSARLGALSVATLDDGDLAVSAESGERPDRFRQTRAQETELPAAIKLSYGDPGRDDQPASAEARRSAGGSRRVLEIGLPAIMAEGQATRLAEIELSRVWIARERAEFGLPPSMLRLDPGDVVDFLPTRTTLRLAEIHDAGLRRAEAHRVDPQAAAPVPRASSAPPSPPVTLYLGAQLTLIDGPLLRDGDADDAAHMAGVMKPWRAGMAVYRSADDTDFALDTLLVTPATAGVTLEDLYAGPIWRWDRGNTLTVRLVSGALYSATERQVLDGANAALVENEDGEWELLQFAEVAALGDGAFALTGLLRGQRGTEHAMRAPVPAGARFVLVNEALQQWTLDAAAIGLSRNWRFGPADRDIASQDYDQEAFTFRAKARRPLSPARLKGHRIAATGDWQLTWIRRTRIGGDAWSETEVPLGEEEERYRLEILDGPGGSVLRAVEPTEAGFLYTAAHQTDDFGSPQTGFHARVAQRSARYGLGIWRTGFVYD